MKVACHPPSLSDYWRRQRKALQQLLWGVSAKGSVGTALVQAVRQPLTHHVQQYVLLLLSLRDTVGEVGGRARRCSPCLSRGEAQGGEPCGPGSGHLPYSGSLV